MTSTATAHVDTFARDHLPPREQWPDFEFTIPEVDYPERLNAATELIDKPTAKHGRDRLALLTPEGERWTYGQLLDRANQIANVLTEDFGVVPGNRVMLRALNTPWLVAQWLAVLKVGGVAVTIMPLLRAHEVRDLVKLTRPVVSITNHDYLEGMLEPAAEHGVRVIACNGGDDDDLTVLAGQKSTEFDNVATASDDVALLGPTSGTTGTPKATMHFHRDILANADTFARYVIRPTRDDLFAGSAPFAFTFGLGTLVVFPLYFGAASLLTRMMPPVQLAEAVAEARATIVATAPTAYRAIIKEGRAELLDSVRVGISAGEHLPASVWKDVHQATGIKLVDGIGSTEMLHVFISAAGDDIRPGAIGKPVPGYRAAILGLNDEELPDGEPGRLAVIGPTGCRYLDDARQSQYVVNGWNVTGDTCVRDGDGYYWYQARNDDMIISSGYNIGAPEVESAVNDHPDVLENAVIGLPDDKRGSLVSSFIVLRDGVDGDAGKIREIQDFVKQRIAPYKYPRHVEFVDSLPRNPSGKLQRFKLRETATQ